ncbi:thioesterase II family protein [Streptomyces roseicoloratus]|uniref:Alpha/beta fold hydrolase n=1 Tax=Streptomyces roseicoloratus TaxID=2508722 RepID=A0ABY9S2D8_9ACTN|nr:alpha/beta fold hydrolase [Streptomyces roseicoloratus]WMX48576.1 alpha/beta fold hydrolase [Streptomyces roseicoloratus]
MVTRLATPPTGRPLVHGAVTCPRPVPGAALRLFLFHHAGGSHLLYRDWEHEFPADWEVCVLDAPGRGRLSGAPLIDDSDELVAFFADELLPWTDRPFAFFGHSMGALVAYELTRRLTAEGRPLPVWTGLSACGAPQADRDPGKPRARHLLTDRELRDWLRSVGGTPDALLDEDVAWRYFGPVFRSDFALVDTWRPELDAEPLRTAVSAFGGSGDPVVGRDRLAAWAARTERFLGLNMFDGGHFYLADHRRALTRRITAAVAAARRTAQGHPV